MALKCLPQFGITFHLIDQKMVIRNAITRAAHLHQRITVGNGRGFRRDHHNAHMGHGRQGQNGIVYARAQVQKQETVWGK